MDKPENCPDEMYAVMQKCWKIDAADRPSFATLAIIFDRILQEKTGYLDLSQTNSQLSDLYNKCFTSSHSEKQEEDGLKSETDTVLTNDSSGEDLDKVNIFTVCNETYNSDNYLVPTPSCPHSSETDHFLPLLETRVSELGDSDIAKRNSRCEDTGTQVHETEFDAIDTKTCDKVKLDENKDLVVKDENAKVNEQKRRNVENSGRLKCNSRFVSSKREQEPMFKKKTENSLPTIRYTKNNKNKHVIYPCENVALLTETGNARCVRDNDSAEHEVSQF